MELDFTPLQKTLDGLSDAVTTTQDIAFMASLNDAQSRTIQAGVIQNFEFIYEVSWKFFRRQLKDEEGNNEVGAMSRKDLYRLAAKKLIDDPEAWFVFHKARNETSHGYNQQIAKEVHNVIIDFLPARQALLAKQLKR